MWASRDAGRIVAEIAAIRRNPRLMPVKRRRVVVEVRGIGGGWQATRNNAGRQRAVRHGTQCPPLSVLQKLAQVNFFIKR
jgi:hypothetical protein